MQTSEGGERQTPVYFDTLTPHSGPEDRSGIDTEIPNPGDISKGPSRNIPCIAYLHLNSNVYSYRLPFKVFPFRLPQGSHSFLTSCRKEAKAKFPLLPTSAHRLEGTTLAK